MLFQEYGQGTALAIFSSPCVHGADRVWVHLGRQTVYGDGEGLDFLKYIPVRQLCTREPFALLVQGGLSSFDSLFVDVQRKRLVMPS